MQNMEGPSSHLLPPVPDFCCCWGGRAKAASPDSVCGLVYYCCIDGGLLNEKIMICQKNVKNGNEKPFTIP